MGVSGSGKSTVGALLAERLGWENDRRGPPAPAGERREDAPRLEDADREPWLNKIGEELNAWAHAGRPDVLTCSALKRAYRARIVAARPDVRFVYLKGSEDLITGPVNVRHHEYMPASLLHSQFETLEPPMPGESVITVDAGDLPKVEVQKIIDALGVFGSPAEPGTSS
jgi:gluconokinase